MSILCKDCQDIRCSQIHRDYDPMSCKLSNGDPCEECCELAVLDDHISQVHAQLVELAHKRRLLKNKMIHRHGPFIHCLPVEISSNIFATYMDDIDSAFDVYKAKGLEDWSPAMHLSSVCVTWRNIIRRTADFWRVIRVPLLRNHVNVKHLSEHMTELFTLSAQHTLSLGLYQVYYEDSLDDGYLFKAHFSRLDSLYDLPAIPRAVTSRCNEITFHGLPLEQIRHLFCHTDAPILKKLRIYAPYGQFESGYYCHSISEDVSLRASLQLEEVEITSGTRLLPRLKINWDNITTAKMHEVDLNDAFKILLLAPRLKAYTISIEVSGFPGSWLPFLLDLPITHTTLESLEFYPTIHDVVALFLQGINFPSLKEFKFHAPSGFNGAQSPLEHLPSFFERSPCRLMSLSLHMHSATTDHDILNVLNALSTLIHLSITVPGGVGRTFMTDVFFQELAQPTSGSLQMIAPRLEAFSYTGPLNFTWPAFLKIFDPPPTFIPDGDSPVEYIRPLRTVSLRLRAEKTTNLDDYVLSKLRENQVTVELKTVPVTPFIW